MVCQEKCLLFCSSGSCTVGKRLFLSLLSLLVCMTMHYCQHMLTNSVYCVITIYKLLRFFLYNNYHTRKYKNESYK